ncbi:MAG: HD family hydrolase, partial [Pseudomonadota bacterium]
MAANSLTPHKNAAANPLAARGLEAADREPAPLDASSAQPHSPRAWQRMLSGRRLDLLAPSPTDVEISDIAHGLARVARWNGQTIGDHAFSVAQHALLVERITHDLAPDWP